MTEETKEKKKRKPISDDKKKYKCSVCGKPISNPSALAMHMKTHAPKEGEDKSFRGKDRGSVEKNQGSGGEESSGSWIDDII